MHRISRNKGRFILLLSLSALLLLSGVGLWLFHSHYIVIDSQVYARTVSYMDLSGSDIDNFSALGKMKQLETVNLTHTSIQDLSALDGCTALKKVIASGSDFPAEQCIAFYAKHPQASLQCGVRIGNHTYNSSLQDLTIAEASEEELRELAALRQLQTLDLTACMVSDEIFDHLHERLPDCIIIRRLSFNGREWLSNTASVKLTADFFTTGGEQEMQRLKYFTELAIIDATTCTDVPSLAAMKQAFPQYRIKWNITVLGTRTNTLATALDLSGQKHTLSEFQTAFQQTLPYFYNLQKIDMCGCGLATASMNQLREAYPDIKFVWYISFGRWKVRTDAVSFSSLVKTKEEGRQWNEHHFAPLFQYCTDLVTLDLGHCHVRDISGIANLKNLRALILTDNYVEDITPLKELDKLEFLEMNSNHVQSVEPLKDLPHLEMVNLYGSSKATDLSPLYAHDKLRMVIFDKAVPAEEQQRFTASNPQCTAFFTVDLDGKVTTNEEWRTDALREKYKQTFRNWRNVTKFDEETKTFTFDFVNGQYNK